MPHFQDTTPESRAYELGILRDAQVKGRVVTTMQPVTLQIGYNIHSARKGWLVKQVIDGVVYTTLTYEDRLIAAADFATLRAHARRNLHEFLSSVRPEKASYPE